MLRQGHSAEEHADTEHSKGPHNQHCAALRLQPHTFNVGTRGPPHHNARVDSQTLDMFSRPARETVIEGAVLLRQFAVQQVPQLLIDLEAVIRQAPWRHMVTPGGKRMSVAMTNCGALGWVTDARGYRYQATDPLSNLSWPAMPNSFRERASRAADEAGFTTFEPDACLVNQYLAKTQMTLHQDKNEKDFTQPIVSVSVGLPATFLFGGFERSDKAQRVALQHGDVVIWGAAARLRFHGILSLKPGSHALLGPRRINLTFRKAG